LVQIIGKSENRSDNVFEHVGRSKNINQLIMK